MRFYPDRNTHYANPKLCRPKGIHPEVVSHAQELFSILQKTDLVEVQKWVVKTCSTRIILRLKTCKDVNEDILRQLETYKPTENDRRTFESTFPDGISVDNPEVQALGLYVQTVKQVPVDGRITVDNVGHWLNVVGKIPKHLWRFLTQSDAGVKSRMRDVKVPDRDLEDAGYIYNQLRNSLKLFTSTPILKFLSQIPCFSHCKPLIYLAPFIH